MRAPEVAKRYAKALFALAVDNRSQEKVFGDLRSIAEIFAKDKETHNFLVSPMITPLQKEDVLKKVLNDKGVSKEVVDTLLLLARNERLNVFPELVHAFESEIDSSNGVIRGTVRSASTLAPEERQRIEQTVEKYLNKKVIMTYVVDPAVIGGLVAQVGSYTFDDSIAAHLTRMNEELKAGVTV
jgi:F-type H+-transporting ATPase subunit delta